MHARIAHHSRRRIRLRIPEAKHRPEALNRIAGHIAKDSNVESTEVNPNTGSILVHYAEEAAAALRTLAEVLSSSEPEVELAEDLVEAGVSAWAGGGRSATAQNLADLLGAADGAVKQVTGNKFDLRLLLPAAAAVLGLAHLNKREVSTPLWVTLMIFAFTSFTNLDPGEHASTDHQWKKHETTHSGAKQYLH